MVHISPGYSAYLNLDKEMIARAPIVTVKLNLKLTQECLESTYVSQQCDTFNNNTLVYHFLFKIFTDTDAYVSMKQRKSMHDGQTMFFVVHKQFLGPDFVARQATEAAKLSL